MEAQTTTAATAKKASRTSLGLRDTLFDEIDMLRDGTSTPQRATAISKIATQIVQTVRLEIEHQRYLSGVKQENNEFREIKPLKLGTEQTEIATPASH